MTQPVGAPLPDWTPPPPDLPEVLGGRYARLERLDLAVHGDPLRKAVLVEESDSDWTYLPYGPFHDPRELDAWLSWAAASTDPLFYAIRDEDGAVAGVASYLRIAPQSGSIEVGHIHFTRPLQRTRAATESMYLMMREAFELGYRRYEWKCDALNQRSRSAALRLGFTFEGVFRQATVYKARNRDTAWYSVIDTEWPAVRDRFVRWLDPSNFAEDGTQLRPLASPRVATEVG